MSSELPNPYIGCKISLVSQADIRYEGILYSVDQKSSNIALTEVRSFGSEDRKKDIVVPARNDVFECIIFKAADIKDLRICERAKSPVQIKDFPLSKLEDPAILSVHHSMPPQPSQTGAPSLIFSQLGKAAEEAMEVTEKVKEKTDKEEKEETVEQEQTKEANEIQSSGDDEDPAGYDGGPVKLLYNRGEMERASANRYRTRNFDGAGYGPPRGFPPAFFDGDGRDPRLRPSAQPFHPTRLPPMPPPHLLRHGFLGHGSDQHHPPAFRRPLQPFFEQYGQAPMSPGFLPPPHLRRPSREFPGRGFGGGGDGMDCWSGLHEPSSYDVDYDFEAANAVFEHTLSKLKLWDEAGQGPIGRGGLREVGTKGQIRKTAPPPPPPKPQTPANDRADGFYEPKKSFFDRISSDAADKNAGRPLWKKRAEVDGETFGDADASFFSPHSPTGEGSSALPPPWPTRPFPANASFFGQSSPQSPSLFTRL